MAFFGQTKQALSCWNKQRCPWKRYCLDGNICCSKISINVAFTDIQVIYVHQHSPGQTLTLEFRVVTVWMVQFGPKDQTSMPPKKLFIMWTRQTSVSVKSIFFFTLFPQPNEISMQSQSKTAALNIRLIGLIVASSCQHADMKLRNQIRGNKTL